MTLYGLYMRDLDTGDLVWFTTEKPLQPGAYWRGRQHAGSADVHVAESIPALVLQVGSVIQEAEDHAQSSLGTGDMPANAERRIESEMTDALLQRLTKSSNIWVSEPRWVDNLSPASESGDLTR